MGDWNLSEFKTLCLNLGLDELLFYTRNLALKWKAAIYHRENIEKRLSELEKTRLKSPPTKVLQYEQEITFELDALMAALNSAWDILAQLLNECFVKTDTSEVSFSKFSNPKECCYRLIPSEIQPILRRIRGNALYRITKAYANVSKHRYVPPGEIHMDVGEKPPEVSYVIPEFEYKKGEWHKLTPDKAFKCLEFVGKSVDQIGAKIQEEVKLGRIT